MPRCHVSFFVIAGEKYDMISFFNFFFSLNHSLHDIFKVYIHTCMNLYNFKIASYIITFFPLQHHQQMLSVSLILYASSFKYILCCLCVGISCCGWLGLQEYFEKSNNTSNGIKLLKVIVPCT